MRWSVTVVARAALPLALIGCGGGSGGTLSFDELGPAIIAASCRASVLCEQSPDQATCLASTQFTPSIFETMRADIASGLVRYDAHAARACVDTYATLDECTFTAIVRFDRGLDATCGKVFTGTLPAGSACYFDEECADHGQCDRPSCSSAGGCCVGTCLRRIVVQAGGDCGQPGSECVAGTTCAVTQNLSGITCQPSLGPGAACTAINDTCDLPYTCVTPDSTVDQGTCEPPSARGEACGDPTGIGIRCNDVRDACDTTTSLCAQRSPVGGACSTATAACTGVAVCDGVTCIARGRAGDTCNPSLASACLGSMACDATMHCALPPASVSCR
jgi:hypothetical protein